MFGASSASPGARPRGGPWRVRELRLQRLELRGLLVELQLRARGRGCELVELSFDAGSAAGVALTGVPSCVSSRFRIVASSPSRPASPAAVVDTVVESVSRRWPRSPTFAVSSSICLEPPCVERSADESSDRLPELAGARAGRPAARRSRIERRAPGAARRAAWSSRRRLAISPSFFAIADAVVATVAASVSTRSLSTSRRATNRASCFESLLEDGSTTRRVFPRRGHRWVQGTCGHPHLAYRCGERVARSLVRVSARFRTRGASRARRAVARASAGSRARARRRCGGARRSGRPRGGRASCPRRHPSARIRPSSARRRSRPPSSSASISSRSPTRPSRVGTEKSRIGRLRYRARRHDERRVRLELARLREIEEEGHARRPRGPAPRAARSPVPTRTDAGLRSGALAR